MDFVVNNFHNLNLIIAFLKIYKVYMYSSEKLPSFMTSFFLLSK